MIKSAYIHIPFCSRKCNYCTFVSYDTLTLKNIYVDSLINEISARYKEECLNTIYFGGGTPSILATQDFKLILDKLNFDKNTEITAELNPEVIKREYLDELLNIGINRLSIGVQVFDNEILKIIGRRHTKEKAIETVKQAQNAGFKNISVDLIYGLPRQNIDNLYKSLQDVLDLGVQHVSLYGLKIEEGCNFFNNRPEFLPENDEQAQMYVESVKYLKENGFEHYEISNFCKKGYESKHNINYWKNGYYYGFGVAASGYEKNLRYSNTRNIEKYIKNPLIKDEETEVSKTNRLEEEIFLGLRLEKGINIKEINKKFNIDFELKYKPILEKYTKSNHLIKTEKGYKLSLAGVLVSNIILADFIED